MADWLKMIYVQSRPSQLDPPSGNTATSRDTKPEQRAMARPTYRNLGKSGLRVSNIGF
ncbi:hypothetical protein PoB_003477600, partial [Plakobranchus ocellatus]